MHFKPKNLKNRLNDRLERIRKPIESELALVFSSEQPVPSSIFQDRSAAVLETLVGYLKEKRQLPLRSIAMLLNRDERTIWTAYHRGSLKPKKHADHHPTSVPLPLEKLRNRKLSILESIVLYLLKDAGFSLHRIAVLLNRNDRTIWTVAHRAQRKVRS